MVDAKYSLVCPIACGVCCVEYWREVVEPEFPEQEVCPHLGPKGCKLPRKDRPDGCIEYMCELAEMARAGGVTKEQVALVLEAAAQENPHMVLGRVHRTQSAVARLYPEGAMTKCSHQKT